MPTISPEEILSVEPPEEPPEEPAEQQPDLRTGQGKVTTWANRYNVPLDLALRVARQESGFAHIDPKTGRPKVNPKSGAIGLMQLMPNTAKGLGVDPMNEDENAEGGVRYLRDLLTRYKGNQAYAAAAYNEGPTAFDRAGQVPDNAETRNYVKGLPETGTPPGAPSDTQVSRTLSAQSNQPPAGPVRYSPPVRVVPGAGTGRELPEPSYDPTYGDPVLGKQTFAGITALHKAGMATMTTPENYVSRDGKEKVTAIQVYSPHSAHIGLWTEDGRKLDSKKGWVRVGLGAGGAGGAGGEGGGLKNLEHFVAKNKKTGETFLMQMDPASGEMWKVGDLGDTGSQGPLHYMYNRTTGRTGYVQEGTMVTPPGTKFATNADGDELEPAFTPLQIAEERGRARDEKEREYLRLHDKVADMKGMVERGELDALRTSFSIPVPPGYEKDKAHHYAGIRQFEMEHANEIEKRALDHENMIKRDWEHRTVTPEEAKKDEAKPKKRTRFKGVDVLQVSPGNIGKQ